MPVQADLVTAALQEVGAVSAGEPAAPEDVTAASARVASVIADIEARRVVPTINLADIPNPYFPDLVKVLAEHIAPMFGRALDPQALALAEARLRATYHSDRSAITDLEEAVYDRLTGLGALAAAIDPTALTRLVSNVASDLFNRRVIASASVPALTAAQVPHIVTIVAARIDPAKTSPADVAEAENRLRAADRLSGAGATAFQTAVLEFLEANGAGTHTIDAAMIGRVVTRQLADLNSRRVIAIANEAAIGPAHHLPLVTLVAARLKPGLVARPVIEQAEAELRAVDRLTRANADPLVLAVLEQLEIFGAGSATIDTTAISGRIDQTLTELADRGVIHLSAEDLPESVIPDLSRYIAAGLASPPIMQVMNVSESRLRRLAAHQVGSRDLEPVRTDYF